MAPAVDLYTLKDGAVEARIITYGGIVQSLKVPDKKGNVADVVLGFDTLDEYVNGNKAYFGALIGRYGNRIAGGNFQLDGQDGFYAVKRRPRPGSSSKHSPRRPQRIRQGCLDG